QLTTGAVYLDDCGRYRLPDIAQPGPPGIIALGFDDAGMPPGPSGITNAVGVAVTAAPNTATRDVEGFIVKPSTSTAWGSSGGPALSLGIYAPVFRSHKTGSELASGVTVLFAPAATPTNLMPNMGRDFYWAAAATTRGSLEPTANAT